MQTALWCNVIGVLSIAVLLGLAAGLDVTERLAVAFVVGWTLLCFSAMGWVIYVLVHFTSKFW